MAGVYPTDLPTIRALLLAGEVGVFFVQNIAGAAGRQVAAGSCAAVDLEIAATISQMGRRHTCTPPKNFFMLSQRCIVKERRGSVVYRANALEAAAGRSFGAHGGSNGIND